MPPLVSNHLSPEGDTFYRQMVQFLKVKQKIGIEKIKVERSEVIDEKKLQRYVNQMHYRDLIFDLLLSQM